MSGIRCPMCDYPVDECSCEDRYGPGGKPDKKDEVLYNAVVALEMKDRRIEGLQRELDEAKAEIVFLKTTLKHHHVIEDAQQVLVREHSLCKEIREALQADNKRLRELLKRWMHDVYDCNASMTALVCDTKQALEGR